jgi:hypothetical protein
MTPVKPTERCTTTHCLDCADYSRLTAAIEQRDADVQRMLREAAQLSVDQAAELEKARADAEQVCESLGAWAADAIQVGEDGPECRACGYELDDEGRGHSRCAVPLIEEALSILGRKK